jgi:hypothetical protein
MLIVNTAVTGGEAFSLIGESNYCLNG